MTNNIAILLGAGSSIPAGFPSTEELTNSVLSGNGIWRVSNGTYLIEENPSENRRRYLELENRLPAVKLMVRRLHAEAEKYYSTFGWRAANYEDIFYLAEQLYADDRGERENPAIYLFIKEIKYDMSLLIKNIESFEITDLLGETINYIIDVVRRKLIVNNSTTDHLEIINDIHNRYNISCISTLCHDVHVEKFLKQQNILVSDGVTRSNNQQNWDGNFLQDDSIPFLKLHGSIDWDWNCSDYDDNRPEILIGTFNKVSDYSKDIFMDIHYCFKSTICQSDTMIICGYGFGDKGINSQIINWYYLEGKREIIIIHPDLPKLILNARYAIKRLIQENSSNSIKFINKYMEDVTINDIVSILGNKV